VLETSLYKFGIRESHGLMTFSPDRNTGRRGGGYGRISDPAEYVQAVIAAGNLSAGPSFLDAMRDESLLSLNRNEERRNRVKRMSPSDGSEG